MACYNFVLNDRENEAVHNLIDALLDPEQEPIPGEMLARLGLCGTCDICRVYFPQEGRSGAAEAVETRGIVCGPCVDIALQLERFEDAGTPRG